MDRQDHAVAVHRSDPELAVLADDLARGVDLRDILAALPAQDRLQPQLDARLPDVIFQAIDRDRIVVLIDDHLAAIVLQHILAPLLGGDRPGVAEQVPDLRADVIAARERIVGDLHAGEVEAVGLDPHRDILRDAGLDRQRIVAIVEAERVDLIGDRVDDVDSEQFVFQRPRRRDLFRRQFVFPLRHLDHRLGRDLLRGGGFQLALDRVFDQVEGQLQRRREPVVDLVAQLLVLGQIVRANDEDIAHGEMVREGGEDRAALGQPFLGLVAGQADRHDRDRPTLHIVGDQGAVAVEEHAARLVEDEVALVVLLLFAHPDLLVAHLQLPEARGERGESGGGQPLEDERATGQPPVIGGLLRGARPFLVSHALDFDPLLHPPGCRFDGGPTPEHNFRSVRSSGSATARPGRAAAPSAS
jgi:hypothetical protein